METTVDWVRKTIPEVAARLSGLIAGDRGQSTASLTDTYWRPIEIASEHATLGAGEKELHMVLAGEERNVHGFSGCNNFTGTFELDEDRLTFGPLASTRKTCFGGMEQEHAFLGALGATERYEIQGQNLALFGDGEEAVARFESVYLT